MTLLTVFLTAVFIPVLLLFSSEFSANLLAAWFWTITGISLKQASGAEILLLPLIRLTACIFVCLLASLLTGHCLSHKLRLFRLKNGYRAFLFTLPVTLFSVFINLLNLAGKPLSIKLPYGIFLCLFQAAYTGILEETAFRGLIIPVMIKKWGRYPHYRLYTILACSAVFGLFHLLNLQSGKSLFDVVMQVCYAACTGCVFAAVFLRTRNLTGIITAHALVDFTGYLNGEQTASSSLTPAAAVITFLLCALCIVWTVYLTKKDHREAVDSLWSDLG